MEKIGVLRIRELHFDDARNVEEAILIEKKRKNASKRLKTFKHLFSLLNSSALLYAGLSVVGTETGNIDLVAKLILFVEGCAGIKKGTKFAINEKLGVSDKIIMATTVTVTSVALILRSLGINIQGTLIDERILGLIASIYGGTVLFKELNYMLDLVLGLDEGKLPKAKENVLKK